MLQSTVKKSSGTFKLVAMQWHCTKSVWRGHLGTWSESDVRRTHQYVTHHFMNVVQLLVERRWQSGNPPRGTVNKFKLNCNAMKLKFIQYPSVEAQAHSTMLNSARFFHLLLSSLWFSLSLSLSSPSSFAWQSNRYIDRMNVDATIDAKTHGIFVEQLNDQYVCPHHVSLSSTGKTQMQTIPVPKIQLQLEMFIWVMAHRRRIKCNVGLELYLFGVSNPHATKSENQTKLYFQFLSENAITPPMLSHMYASMHVSLMNSQSFRRAAAAA